MHQRALKGGCWCCLAPTGQEEFPRKQQMLLAGRDRDWGCGRSLAPTGQEESADVVKGPGGVSREESAFVASADSPWAVVARPRPQPAFTILRANCRG